MANQKKSNKNKTLQQKAQKPRPEQELEAPKAVFNLAPDNSLSDSIGDFLEMFATVALGFVAKAAMESTFNNTPTPAPAASAKPYPRPVPTMGSPANKNEQDFRPVINPRPAPTLGIARS